MRKVLFFIVLFNLTACDENDLRGILEQEAISRVVANKLWLGEYSGSVSDFDSTPPCPNNNVIVQFEFLENGDQIIMNFGDIAGNISEPSLNVDVFENEGDYIEVVATGSGSGQNYNLNGTLEFEDFGSQGAESLQFVGDFEVTQGATTCSFELTLDSRAFDPDSI